jgi:ArsR family transcriptional regulator, virulence genes transcriptional regulator
MVYSKNAEIYKIFAHPTRLEIMNIIRYQEVCVDTLAKVVGIRKSNASQHLAILRHLRLVEIRRKDHNTLYRLADPRIVEPCQILRKLWK